MPLKDFMRKNRTRQLIGLILNKFKPVLNDVEKLKDEALKASNPNLLDNWYFADPINQRGENVYTATTASQYCIDRWLMRQSGLTVTLNDESITCTSVDPESIGLLRQRREKTIPIKKGQSITFSVLYRNLNIPDGVSFYIQMASGDGDRSYNSANATLKNGLLTVTHTSSEDDSIGTVNIIKYGPGKNISVDIIAAKLELGDRQTLAYQDTEGDWVLNDPPPNKVLELAKCRKYFYRMIFANSYVTLGAAQAWAVSSGNYRIRTVVICPVPLRVNPLIDSNISDRFTFSVTGQLFEPVSLDTNLKSNVNGLYLTVEFNCPVEGSNIQLGTVGYIRSNDTVYDNPGYIDFSADL